MSATHESNGRGGDGFDRDITSGQGSAAQRLGRGEKSPASVARESGITVTSVLKELTGASTVLAQQGGKYEILRSITGEKLSEGEPNVFNTKVLADAGIVVMPKVGKGLYVAVEVDGAAQDFVRKLAAAYAKTKTTLAVADVEAALQKDRDAMQRAQG